MLVICLALSLLPAFAQEASLRQANLAAGSGNFDKALSLYEQVGQKEDNNPSFHHMYGRTLALKGDITAAIAHYRKAVKLKGNDAELLNDLGVALSVNAEPEEAVYYLRRAIAANNKFVAAYNNLGATLMHQHDYAAAAAAFKESLKLQPRNEAIKKKLADALSHQAK